MKLNNGMTLYFAKLDMAANMAGTDFADVVMAFDMGEAQDIAQTAVEEWIEMFVTIVDEESMDDDEEDYDDQNNYMYRWDVDSPEIEEYDPEKHDMYMAGGGSFLDRYKEYL